MTRVIRSREIEGPQTGEKSVVGIGTHANEGAHPEALARLFNEGLRIDRGSVRFVYGNPRAAVNSLRHTEDGTDLNRMAKPDANFKPGEKDTYEYRRFKWLDKRWFAGATALYDGHGVRSENAIPYVICQENGLAIAQYMPAEVILTNLDPHEPGGLDYHFNSTGRIGITFEAGTNTDPKSIERAKEGMLVFLSARGHIDYELTKKRQRGFQTYDLYVVKEAWERVGAPVEFTEVSAGTVIAHDGGKPVTVKEDTALVFTGKETAKAGEETMALARRIDIDRLIAAGS